MEPPRALLSPSSKKNKTNPPPKNFLYVREWNFLAPRLKNSLYLGKWNFLALILKFFVYFVKKKFFLYFGKQKSKKNFLYFRKRKFLTFQKMETCKTLAPQKNLIKIFHKTFLSTFL